MALVDQEAGEGESTHEVSATDLMVFFSRDLANF